MTVGKETAMGLVRLLGFSTLSCGCVVGRYRELATNRELAYIEEKGGECPVHEHRRNHAVQAPRAAASASRFTHARAS
ncbi:MAG TPA: hypothetical protein PLT35_11875 [Vicinamibacterales bacterium]|nr:hypothetical protein [Vicinamibacterales bacterium]